MPKKHMKSEGYTDQDWLERMYRKSNSTRTKRIAATSLHTFEIFCKAQNMTKQQMTEKYQYWFNQSKPDIRSICLSLDKFVKLLDADNGSIEQNSIRFEFKRKNPKTIKTYFSFVKSYLRLCHGVKISSEDIARKHSEDMVTRVYFEHESPEGKTFSDRYAEGNFNCEIITSVTETEDGITTKYAMGGENINYLEGYSGVDSISTTAVKGWMNSPGHKENILTKYWKSEGIGVAESGDKIYVTQNFC